MRGEVEQNCINILINSPDLEKSSNYFGLKYEEVEELVDVIKSAEGNKNLSKFPDFMFNNGFIEHFRITSAKENKNGSEHIKKENCFKSKVKAESNKLKEKWSIEQSNSINHSAHWTMTFPNHSYEYLCESFIRNWESHIESMNEYSGPKDTSIFMIQYTDSALEMYENVFEDWIDGMSNGDLREPERVENYRISRDKKILKYVYQFKDKIKYVIFVYGNKYEIIKVASIPYIIGLMPWKYIVAPYIGATIVSSLYEIGRAYPYEEGDIKSE